MCLRYISLWIRVLGVAHALSPSDVHVDQQPPLRELNQIWSLGRAETDRLQDNRIENEEIQEKKLES